MSVHPIVGSWKLRSCVREIAETGEKYEPLGQHPFGRIVYTKSGQIIGILAHEKRPKPNGPIAADGEALELFRTFVSYTGRYELAEDTVIHHVDISWNEAWT
jgi:Lipocalin-like domain